MTGHESTQPLSSSGEGSSITSPDTVTFGTTEHSGGSQSIEDSFANEAVQQIEVLVESFRTGGIKKTQAIYKIGQILAAEPKGNDELKSESLARYASILDGIETITSRSNECGQRLTDSALGKRKDESDRRDQGHGESDRDNAEAPKAIDVEEFFQGLHKGNEPLSGGHDSGEGSDDENEKESNNGLDERGQSNKKQRIYESQMPWFDNEQRVRKSNPNPSCNKTRDILDIFQRDPVAVKRWIRCASTAPAGFPSSEWDSLIKGETVDIDTVFSSLHHIHSIDESVGRVGNTEIQFGRPKAAAKVETSGQWTAAFNLVVKATSFLFPHRYDKLRQYSNYIEELFSAKSTNIHPKLFKYNEAVRYKVGQGQNILLTDRAEFSRYYEAIVAPDGVGTEREDSGSKTRSRKSGKSRERIDICHRFNGAKGCSLDADKCRYRHICKRCRSHGHGKMDCKIEETV